MSITKATCPGWLRISLVRSFRPALGRVNPPQEVSGHGGIGMIETDHLIFKRSNRASQIWLAHGEESVLGEMVIQPPSALIPKEASKSAKSAKCEVGIFEANIPGPAEASNGLWLAGIFARSGYEVLDAAGKSIGGWQGEWLRVFNHPAGRVISRDISSWGWISPAGTLLASWEWMTQDAWQIEFNGLEPNQAYCRLVVLLKAGYMVTRGRTGAK